MTADDLRPCSQSMPLSPEPAGHLMRAIKMTRVGSQRHPHHEGGGTSYETHPQASKVGTS